MAPRTLLVVCVIAIGMLSAAHANVITSCTADIGISGCDDAEGCTYNATYAANGTSVRFTVTVRTDKWVGIGFSLDRFMPDSDVVVGAVDVNSDFFIEDRNVGAGRVQPTVDASQDISDLAAWAGNGLVGIEFTRPRVTPASNDDDISLDQSVYFLFAWGGSLNFDTRTLGQHTNANRQPSDAPYMIPANCVNGVADCGLLIDPANGDITYSDGTIQGSVATYMCDPGFMLEGEMTRNCGSNGEWTGPAVACVAEVTDCGLLIDPANGDITYSDGTVEGSVATYSCDPGFMLEGEMTRNCGSDGEWTGPAVACVAEGSGVADCGLLIDPANGTITYSDGTVEGSVATYSCDPGFMLEGEMTRNCGSNGEWTGPAVACVAEGDDDDDDGSAGMIQASLLVLALMVVVAIFGF